MTYEAGVMQAYRGELVGERLYRRLAMGRSDDLQRAKLTAVSEVERVTNRLLEPIAVRLGIVVPADDVAAVVARRAPELSSLSWAAFAAKAMRDWPPFIDRFLALRRLAPPGDAAAMQFLVDHELALVEFAHLERTGRGDRSLAPLEAFIARATNAQPPSGQ